MKRPAKLSKYRNVRTVVDGITFASKREAERYKTLKLLLNGRAISDLSTQYKYNIMINNQKICSYIADFRYYDRTLCRYITEDAKGSPTPVYRLKKKLMKACHGIDIVEV